MFSPSQSAVSDCCLAHLLIIALYIILNRIRPQCSTKEFLDARIFLAGIRIGVATVRGLRAVPF